MFKLEVVFEMRRHRRDGGDGCMMEAGGALIGCCCEGASSLSLSLLHTQPSRMAKRKPRHNQTEEAGIVRSVGLICAVTWMERIRPGEMYVLKRTFCIEIEANNTYRIYIVLRQAGLFDSNRFYLLQLVQYPKAPKHMNSLVMQSVAWLVAILVWWGHEHEHESCAAPLSESARSNLNLATSLDVLALHRHRNTQHGLFKIKLPYLPTRLNIAKSKMDLISKGQPPW